MSNKVDNFLDKKLEEIQNKKFEENQVKKEKNKNKRKGAIISILSLALAGLIAVGCYFGLKKKNNNKNNINKPSITTVDDLGVDEKLDDNNSKLYGNTTGDIKKEDLVEKNKTTWKDKTAADNSNKVGDKTTNLQDGKLEIDKDGDVIIKDEVDYVVKDEKGEEISSGTTSKDEIPDGYAFDPVLNKIVKKDEVGKFVYADNEYYSKIDGRQYCKKGDVVLKTSLENWKKDPNVTTVKPSENTSSNNTTSSGPETTEKVDQGITNPDGTFTITGVTFKDKATYQAIVLGECNEEDLRYDENGVIYIKENTNSKTR